MISKAVGVVLDMFADDQPVAAPLEVTAFNWGNYAAETLQKSAVGGETASPELGPLASFARDLIAYSLAHPEDATADKYASLALKCG